VSSFDEHAVLSASVAPACATAHLEKLLTTEQLDDIAERLLTFADQVRGAVQSGS